MDRRFVPIARLARFKYLTGVAVVGAFFLLFALGTGSRPRSTSPAADPAPSDLPAVRDRLAAAVEGLHDPDADRREGSTREVLRIARREIAPVRGGEAATALSRQAEDLVELRGDPDAFVRGAERLLGFLDACLQMESVR